LGSSYERAGGGGPREDTSAKTLRRVEQAVRRGSGQDPAGRRFAGHCIPRGAVEEEIARPKHIP